MKARLLKRIRKNIIITRSRNKYNIKVENSFYLHGAETVKDCKKEKIIGQIQALILHVARNNFKRKGRLFY